LRHDITKATPGPLVLGGEICREVEGLCMGRSAGRRLAELIAQDATHPVAAEAEKQAGSAGISWYTSKRMPVGDLRTNGSLECRTIFPLLEDCLFDWLGEALAHGDGMDTNRRLRNSGCSHYGK